MTDRRRNGLILLLVAGLIAALGRRHRDEEDPPGPRPQGRRRARLPGQAHAGPAQGHPGGGRPLDRHHARARRPARRLRARDPALGPRPDRRRAARRQERAARPEAGRQGGPALLLRLGEERPRARPQADPSDPNVTGGPQAGQVGRPLALRRGQARLQAPADPRRQQHDQRPVLPVRPGPRAQAASPGRRNRGRPVLRAAGPAQSRPNAEVVKVNTGTVVVKAEKPDKAPKGTPDTYFVLNDDPALNGTEIKNPEQNTDQGAGGTGAPIVTFEFTDKGRKKWENVTREIAQRGLSHRCPGSRPTRPSSTSPRARRRDHHRAVHLLPRQPGRASTAARARRSRAGSRSPRRRTWPSCSRPAPCRSSSS